MEKELFPREVTSSVPRLTLTGRERLLVEQHQGMVECQEEAICLRTRCGLIRIAGNGLVCLRYSQAEALIGGEIVSVIFDGEGGRRP